MTADPELEESVRELPCDAKLAYVVLEKRGPFTEEELQRETYLNEDETVYAIAVLEEEGLVDAVETDGSTLYDVPTSETAG
jgi:transcription initiation factor IIE alpha subunit